jgi:hypothetical protein
VNSIEDRPDYAGSIGNRYYDKATYSNSTMPLDKNGNDLIDNASHDLLRKLQGWQTDTSAVPLSSIKVFTVCVDQMSGKYMAFLGSDPTKRVTGDSRSEAVAALLSQQKLIVMAEID